MKINKLILTASVISMSVTFSPIAHARDTMMPNGENMKKEIYKQVNEKVAADRAAMKEKFKADQEARKQSRLEQASKRLNETNKWKTTEMTKALTRLSSLVERMGKKTSEAKSKGVDTSSADTAITAAQSAITTAKSAVTAQAAKTYTVTDTTGATSKQMWEDLLATQKIVGLARKATNDASMVIGKIRFTAKLTPTP